MTNAEPGICMECGKAEECLNTSVGWMCRPCFHSAVKNGSKDGGERVYTMPQPGEKTFVVKEPPDTYITIGGVLYAFCRKQDADEIASGLRRGYNIKAFVEEVEAIRALSYVLQRPELRLISVKERLEGKSADSDTVPMPNL